MSEEPREEERRASEAATKIQANFRGYRVRKQLRETSDSGDNRKKQNGRMSRDVADEGRRGSEGRRQEPTRESLEERSATKIQAGVRGYLVRKRQQVARAAATRIQAGFRGFRARKLLKQNGQ